MIRPRRYTCKCLREEKNRRERDKDIATCVMDLIGISAYQYTSRIIDGGSLARGILFFSPWVLLLYRMPIDVGGTSNTTNNNNI